MRIYLKEDIDNKFAKAISIIESDEIDAKMPGIIVGGLSLAIDSRIQQLKNGQGSFNSREVEICIMFLNAL